ALPPESVSQLASQIARLRSAALVVACPQALPFFVVRHPAAGLPLLFPAYKDVFPNRQTVDLCLAATATPLPPWREVRLPQSNWRLIRMFSPSAARPTASTRLSP